MADRLVLFIFINSYTLTIRTSTWEDNEGKKRFTTEINYDNFLFLSPQNQPVKE